MGRSISFVIARFLSWCGGIQAGKAVGTKTPSAASLPGEKTWPDLVLEFLFPAIEVPYGLACKQGRFELTQQGADLVRIGARMNFDDVLSQFRHGQVCRQSEAAVYQEAQHLAPVIRVLLLIGAANTEPQA